MFLEDYYKGRILKEVRWVEQDCLGLTMSANQRQKLMNINFSYEEERRWRTPALLNLWRALQ